MDRNEEIRLGLKSAGIPDFAMKTTLLLQNLPEMRELITNKTLIKSGSMNGLFIYPAKKTSISQARNAFYLCAKELYLTGTTVCCIPLARLITAITTEDYEGDASRVEDVDMVFVLDFYEEGAPFPLQAYESAKLRAWLRGKFEGGGAVSFLSDSPLSRCEQWWPASLLGFITDHVVIRHIP